MASTSIELNINGKKHLVEVEPTTPLLWVIREHVGLKEQSLDVELLNVEHAPFI